MQIGPRDFDTQQIVARSGERHPFLSVDEFVVGGSNGCGKDDGL